MANNSSPFPLLPYELKYKIVKNLQDGSSDSFSPNTTTAATTTTAAAAVSASSKHQNNACQPTEITSLSLISKQWYQACMECAFESFEAYGTIEKDSFNHRSEVRQFTRKLKLCRFSKINKNMFENDECCGDELNATTTADSAGTGDDVDNRLYSMDKNPGQYFAAAAKIFPKVTKAAFWLTHNPAEMIECVGKHFKNVDDIDLECVLSGWPYVEPNTDYGITNAIRTLPNQLRTLSISCWYPPNTFIETLAIHQPQLEAIKMYAHLDTFNIDKKHVFPHLRSLNLMTVVAGANYDPQKDKLALHSRNFPQLEELIINHTYFMSDSSHDIPFVLSNVLAAPWPNVISLKLPMIADTIANCIPEAFPNLIAIRSEFSNCRIKKTPEQDVMKNTVLTYHGFLTIVQSLSKLRVISLGSNYFNTLKFVDDRIIASKVVGSPSAVGSTVGSIKAGSSQSSPYSSDDEETLVETPSNIDATYFKPHFDHANPPSQYIASLCDPNQYDIIPWACSQLRVLKVASAPITLPCLLHMLNQLHYLQFINVYFGRSPTAKDFADIVSLIPVEKYPTITTLCIKLDEAKNIDGEFWSNFFSIFPNLKYVLFEPKRFGLDQSLQRMFPNIVFDRNSRF
ncbi:hypothetical protein H4219_003035 [Mycoemilia scoparia]|uniref:Uncharacterized protein n=1 Tax=Mycoemilia scoparia TaxID=417184 RepID=A0A9W8A150_9FUNG|nr:hypothetical protein H4219_003035 [Mycoemilia scoparia]